MTIKLPPDLPPELQAQAIELTKVLADQGQLIEAGFAMLTMLMKARGGKYSPEAVDAMRSMFFAGAKHTFDSIMVVVAPGTGEPSPDELAKVESIYNELNRFGEYLQTKILANTVRKQ